MVEDITNMDSNKVEASKTRINVKLGEEVKGRVRFRDIHGTDGTSSSFVYYFVTIYTNNQYITMRNAEEVIESSINRLYSRPSNYTRSSNQSKDNGVNHGVNHDDVDQEMFTESLEEQMDGNGW
jgi:hypothetical protein